MKCPICNLEQPGPPPQCRKCGFRFGSYRPTGRSREAASPPDNAGVVRRYAAPFTLLVAVSAALAFARPGYHADLSEADEDGFLEHATLVQMCIENQRQSGADDEHARESCLREAREKKRAKDRGDEVSNALSLVPASEVARVELFLQAYNPSPNSENTRIRVEPRIVLYDNKGRSVAAEGTLTLAVHPQDCGAVPEIPDLEAASFRRAKFGDSKQLLVFNQLPDVYLSPETVDATNVEFSVTFDGGLEGRSLLALDEAPE
ncbi:MAG: hypothetical protein U0136_18095 [Bdellovibrionota bacterium]